jgi:CDP-diacylglycerol--serine O-phosphatidyltransferase
MRTSLKRKPVIRTQSARVRLKKLTLRKEKLKKGIYIIPSLFTCGNMAFGVLSVFSSINGQFIPAAWFLIGALACDILDGRIARMTKTTSDFGLQLDSLSDLISFGTAPAMMMYMMVLKGMGKPGIAIAILYVLCAALRLARFNVIAQSGEVKKHFLGLPTPASAGLIISFVLSYELLASDGNSFSSKKIPELMTLMPTFFRIMPIVIVVLSFLMVSNIPYMSFKKLRLSRVKTIELLVLVIVLVILIVVYPQNIIFIIFSIYVLSGLLLYVPGLIIKRRNIKKQERQENPTTDEV